MYALSLLKLVMDCAGSLQVIVLTGLCSPLLDVFVGSEAIDGGMVSGWWMHCAVDQNNRLVKNESLTNNH
jgi:hypothetical protein